MEPGNQQRPTERLEETDRDLHTGVFSLGLCVCFMSDSKHFLISPLSLSLSLLISLHVTDDESVKRETISCSLSNIYIYAVTVER